MRRTNPYGFTLIELMMVVAIVGLLAAIAIPKFGDLVLKAREAKAKGQLGAFRGAITLYYANTEGITMGYFGPLGGHYWAVYGSLVPRYLDAIPEVLIPCRVHSQSQPWNQIATVSHVGSGHSNAGGWGWHYVSRTGRVHLECDALDSKGNVWSQI